MQSLFDPKEIDIQTKIIAKKISAEHQGDKTPVVMVGLLNGAFMFYADLVRNMSIDVECDFMRVKSYTAQFKQGDIKILKDLETPIKGKHVYLVDDIYDTGSTMKALIEYLEVKKPASISIVTLLTRETSPIPSQPSYHAFTIKDEWVVGFGMDDEKGYSRNLNGVFAL
jgi:hypoxanthine phosphoribosyltransferase